jgi:septal ring factor EnvC (AmiA/AmiB activator)
METNTMQKKMKTTGIVLLLVPAFLLTGCSSMPQPVRPAVAPHLIEMQQNESVARRFQESNPQTPSPVESAIQLSERYAKLSEEAASLRQQNKGITTRNQQLNDHIFTLEAQLKQAKKELTEANDLLIEMRIELNTWKSDVLGFRKEMREAQTAQLEALFRILKLLGGQVTADAGNDISRPKEASGSAVGSAVASTNHPDRP